jgi:uncharacterized membrane protein YhfC
MIGNKLLAGLVAGVPLAVMAVVYVLVRGHALAEVMTADGDGFARLSDAQMTLVMVAMFVAWALAFGLLAGLVYKWVGTPKVYLGIALGLAALFSLAAIASRTPMMADKVGMNVVVALVFGILVPLLAGV